MPTSFVEYFDPPDNQNHIFSALRPQRLYGTKALDPAVAPWSNAPVNSTYERNVETGHVQFWRKVADNNDARDWTVRGFLQQEVNIDDFVDGGGTTGTLTMTPTLPAYVFVDYLTARVTEAFAVAMTDIDVGSGSDADQFNKTGTWTATTLNAYGDPGQPSGVRHIGTAFQPIVTLTHGTDFTLIKNGLTGKLLLRLFYTG